MTRTASSRAALLLTALLALTACSTGRDAVARAGSSSSSRRAARRRSSTTRRRPAARSRNSPARTCWNRESRSPCPAMPVTGAMDGVTPSVRVAARVLTAGALLAGLFLMHGLAVGEVTGCSGGTRAMATSVMPPAPAPADAVAHADGAPVATVPHTAGHGEVCVSTPARLRLAGLLALASIAVVVLTSPAWPGLGEVRRRCAGRGTPRAGPALLVKLCVSRT